ncbi:DM13 domain-containing protein, partial [Nitrosopumilus sp. b2]|uniref:DM13 domain-containing protein n=1 Tax=Nitrosopumilus sp. b2 TaxID=2109908 RepID=UPI001C70DF27
MMDETMMDETMMDETMMDETIKHVTSVVYSGTFVGVGDGIHDAQGIAYTIPLDDGSNVLRLENFQSTNGPDLYVYLATDDNASEFLNLGELKANRGNQNYEIPDDADLTKFNKVLIWCKAFSVLFGSAELS